MFSKLQNNCLLAVGYVTRAAELKKTTTGKTFAKWSMSVGQKPSQADPNKRETIFVECVAWHDKARYAASIVKGDTVFVIGTVKQSEYNGKTYKNLDCEYISIMGKGSSVTTAPAQQATQTADSDILAEYEEMLGNGNVPF